MNQKQGKVIWITGLSGAGKSTLALKIVQFLQEMEKPVILLDGDELREVMNAKSFDHNSRIEIGIRYCKLCKLISSQGINVVIAVIGLFKEIYNWHDKYLKEIYTIFLDVPMEELIHRDSKNIYSKAIKKELINVVGIDIPVDLPTNNFIHIQWNSLMTQSSIENFVKEKLTHIYK